MDLADFFTQLFVYVLSLQRNSGENKRYDEARSDIRELLLQSEACLEKGGVSREEYDDARFAVCAWIDEALLGSAWQDKGLWQKEPLQLFYYRTTDAGVEFFERLAAIGADRREVRECYYLCLALGFKGHYINPGDEYPLEQLKSSNLNALIGGPAGLPSLDRGELFPDPDPQQGPGIPSPERLPLSLMTIATLASPVVLFGILYLVYRFALSSLSGKLF